MKRRLLFVPIALLTLTLSACHWNFLPSSSSTTATTTSNPTTGGTTSDPTTTGSTGGTTGTTSSGTSSTTSTGTSSTSSSSSVTSSSSSATSSSVSSTTSGSSGPLVRTKLDYDYNDYINYNAYEFSNCPTVGSAKVLIIPVWFTDSGSYISTSKKATVRADIEKAYLGTNEETGWRSVKSYYEELSQNRLSLDGTVSEWYECGKASSAYATDTSSLSATTAFVKTATDWYFTNHSSESRTDYDKDGNGYLDAVLLIYAAPDYQTSGNDSQDNFWAYCYWIQKSSYKNVSSPGPNVFFWASYDFMYSSGSDAYAATGSNYGNGDTSHCNIDAHTFIHEMGHVLGLEDYYDYSNQHNPAGGFSMQDWNVGSHDAFSTMASGYSDPYIPTATTTIDIKPFQENRDLILLSSHNASVNSPFDEYLLLELYTPTGLNEFDSTYAYKPDGYPQGPATAGIRLWHVDARLTFWKSGGWSTSLTSNPSVSNITLAMSNTYYKSDVVDYCSVLGDGYYDFNLLQLIKNSTTATSYTGANECLEGSDLFVAGDTFTMSTYGKQFVKTGKMNSNTALGWSFRVDACSSSGATITVTKA